MIAVVEGEIHARLRARVQQTGTLGVLADCACDARFRQTRHNFFPGLARIACAVEVRTPVALSGDRGVRDIRVVVGCFDEKNTALFRQARRRHVLPVRTVTRDVDQAVARTDPDFRSLDWRRRDSQDIPAPGILRGFPRFAIVKVEVAASGLGLFYRFCFRLAGQIGADFFPRQSTIGGFEHKLGTEIQGVGIARRKN